MTTRPPRVVVLTEDGSRYGRQLLSALAARGLTADAVVVARRSWARRWRLLRSVAGRNGWPMAVAGAMSHLAAEWQAGRAAAPLPAYELLSPRVHRVAAFDAPPALDLLRSLEADWFLLGQTGILRPATLACAGRGVLNAHPGWLPDFRGVHVAWWTLAAGRPDRLGSTLHFVDAGIDTGAIVARRNLDHASLPAFDQLEARLYHDCVSLLVEAAATIRDGGAPVATPQPAGEGRLYFAAPFRVRRAARRVYEQWRDGFPAVAAKRNV